MRCGVVLLVALLPIALFGQGPEPAPRGAAVVTTESIRRRIGVIADDSMLGRATPSRELDQVANYVADEFRRYGLKAGGDGGTFLQRYPLDVEQFDPENATIRALGHVPTTWRMGPEVVLLQGDLPPRDTAGGAVVVTGDLNSSALEPRALAGRVVFLADDPRATLVASKLVAHGPLALVLVGEYPDPTWEAARRTAGRRVRNPEEAPIPRLPLVLAVRARTVRALFTGAGIPADSLRAWDARPLATHALAGVRLELAAHQPPVERASAPNVVGILEGSDPTLKQEYVFFTAHMDHIGTPGAGEGCTARGGDSICNGADDDGSGTATVLALAEAFATAPERPRRSLVFMTVSGEERGLWGSAYYTAHPTVPLADVVADLNSDMVGRNAKDTVAVIGREHSTLGGVVDRVAHAHPELGIKPVGDLWPGERLFSRSDHYNFARRGVPILFFTTGLHADYHQVSDSPEKIDAEKTARFARLLFYVGLAVANAPARPRWNPASYRQVVGAPE